MDFLVEYINWIEDFDAEYINWVKEFDIFDEHNERLPKRYIRDVRNPFEWWSDDEFIKRYRFRKKSVIHYILPRIEEPLRKASRRGLPILKIVIIIHQSNEILYMQRELEGVLLGDDNGCPSLPYLYTPVYVNCQLLLYVMHMPHRTFADIYFIE
ncbi:hypothetical protein ALC60_14731 [Trachymyrmex zeteki]|uniref:Uncharacterized protein n=1 Tax=Mycetomoellerius zeteki TaxID=64791 RepID=A0A151WEK4_9HYME|nr:hypothetical protein ALC60_14731 [Trachymyrmex zeteki]